jgi:quercetin 2,3-dioxygenase
MQTTIIRANERGTADYGWLKPAHYFSFGGWHNPNQVHFGALRVVNDDWIAGGGKFNTHPHDNMEIVTIPFTGTLAHKDSTGGEGIIQAGDVQIMSAGTGVEHSEANGSHTEAVTLFQIWVFPKEKNITPRYDQRNFNIADRKDKWQIVVSPLEADNALWINQDARFALATITKNNTLQHINAFKNSGVFIIAINGSVTVGNIVLQKRDAIGVWDINQVDITASEDAEIIAIEVPMNFS